MRPTKAKRIGFLVVLTLFLSGVAATPAGRADDNRAPDLSVLCSDLQVAAGNKVISHVYAKGVQIYRWDGTAWVFVAPVATLFADRQRRQLALMMPRPAQPTPGSGPPDSTQRMSR